jgi:hypothetical protein
VAKLHDDGVSFSLVSTFGTNGFAKIEDAKDFSFVPGASCCYALDVSANGKIYAAGSYVQRNSANTSPQPFFSYWKVNGTPDTVVRGYSVTSTQNGPANEIYDIIAKDSNLYSAGYTFFNPKFVANGAVRVLNDGLTYRQSQNGLQAMVTPLTATQNYMPFSQYNSVAVETSGAYYFGGIGDSATSPHVCIGKIDTDMEPDTTFNFGFANYALPFDTYEQPSAEIANDALVEVTPSGEESFVLVGSETFHSDGQAHPMIVKVITKKVAGINNTLPYDGIEIFPNPATQSLQIMAEVIQHIVIYDVTGKEIYSNTAVNAKTYSIAVSALSPAIYFITVNGNSPKKFIKID